jgi:hypothetical protein
MLDSAKKTTQSIYEGFLAVPGVSRPTVVLDKELLMDMITGSLA